MGVFPKLPVHMQNYREKFDKNERVRQAVQNTQAGNIELAELNAVLTSLPDVDMTAEIPHPPPMPNTRSEAMHHIPFVVVGGVAVGKKPVM